MQNGLGVGSSEGGRESKAGREGERGRESKALKRAREKDRESAHGSELM